MARFEVFANPDRADAKLTPYLVDVQNDFIAGLDSRVVIPVRRASDFGPRAERLHPLVAIKGEDMVLDTAALAAVPASVLARRVGDLRAQRGVIADALDALFGAY
jgi:toxin CcdB